MTRNAKPSSLAMWLMKRLASGPHADALVGDFIEQYQSGRSAMWFWRQVFLSTLFALKDHPAVVLGALALGWAFLWAFFRFIGGPLGRLDAYLLATGFTQPYSASWWMRSVLMWIVVAFPFLASGWLVAKIASPIPTPVVLTFAVSVSGVIAVALLLDTQGTPINWRVWLTVPLFLMVAPAIVILVGGLFAARRVIP